MKEVRAALRRESHFEKRRPPRPPLENPPPSTIDPTSHEQNRANRVDDVADRVGLSGVTGTATPTRGYPRSILGIDDSEHPRIIGALPAEDYEVQA